MYMYNQIRALFNSLYHSLPEQIGSSSKRTSDFIDKASRQLKAFKCEEMLLNRKLMLPGANVVGIDSSCLLPLAQDHSLQSRVESVNKALKELIGQDIEVIAAKTVQVTVQAQSLNI